MSFVLSPLEYDVDFLVVVVGEWREQEREPSLTRRTKPALVGILYPPSLILSYQPALGHFPSSPLVLPESGRIRFFSSIPGPTHVPAAASDWLFGLVGSRHVGAGARGGSRITSDKAQTSSLRASDIQNLSCLTP